MIYGLKNDSKSMQNINHINYENNINEKKKEIKYMIIDKLKKEKSNYSYRICGIKADYIFRNNCRYGFEFIIMQ